MADKPNDSCQMGCDEEVENYMDYLFSSVKADQVLHFEKLKMVKSIPEISAGVLHFTTLQSWKDCKFANFF